MPSASTGCGWRNSASKDFTDRKNARLAAELFLERRFPQAVIAREQDIAERGSNNCYLCSFRVNGERWGVAVEPTGQDWRLVAYTRLRDPAAF